MIEAYRDKLALCPACRSEMERRRAEDAEVDVCPTCRGLWIDWFDGDTWSVASASLPLSVRAPVVLPPEAACPRCTAALVPSSHTGTAGGPLVYRCNDCAGTFVPRTSLDDLLECVHQETIPPEPPTPLQLLVAKLRRLLGL